jgi:hypothetical protein
MDHKSSHRTRAYEVVLNLDFRQGEQQLAEVTTYNVCR